MFGPDWEVSIDTRLAASLWARARFPKVVMRDHFVERVRLLNRIEDVPRVELRVATGGPEVDYRCVSSRRLGLRKLVESFGGTVVSEPRPESLFDQEWIASAFELR